MRKVLSFSLLAFCMIATTRARADVYSSVSTHYDDSSGQVIAYCEVDMDYEESQYYDPEVNCGINDSNGYNVAVNTSRSFGPGAQEAYTTVQSTVVADETYTGWATAREETLYWDYYENGWYDYFGYYYWQLQGGVWAPCCFDFYRNPGTQEPSQPEIIDGTVYAQVTPPRPTMLKIRQWCRTGFVGNDLPYWLMNSSGTARTQQTWDIIEHQTDTALTPPPNPYGAGTSYQTGQVFDDAIGGLSGHHESYQNFTIGTGPGKPQYPVTIVWFGGTSKSQNHLVIDGSTVVIDGDSGPAQGSCRNNY